MFDQSYMSSSPLLVLSAQHHPQSSFMDHNPLSFTSHFGSNPQTPSSAWSNRPYKSVPSSGAGRKRSRDEAADNLTEDEYFPIQVPTPKSENEDEWVYGEGMTLIKPNRGGIAIEASSQTGTWAEEKAEQEKAQAEAQAKLLSSSPQRPIIRATKSQRLDCSATPALTEEAMQNGALMTPSASSPERTGFTEPTIDDFTRHLGIGWSRISSDEHIQAAAKGWSRFIENHFPVTNAKIALQSKGLASYLVEASEGYFLFDEALKQGRLVSTNLETVWANLQTPVPVFEGQVVMDAAETPKLVGVSSINNETQMAEVNIAINGAQTLEQGNEVEMDMS
ncbi:hypothetical protein HYFRA_00011710 [Hymenoscyphus fraxineus]|uniref:Uncharacterized protein n=1 Tax=Hymenoscyphus fraxineus TaxID=746836 RepID=A0A9N9KXP3_9HELO|nr:hypothetical protein HYFRA_00011710 [Hymenoscyphus fraxineus]